MERAKKWIGLGLSVILLLQSVGYVNAEESSGESQEQILSLAEVSTEVNLDIGEKKEENIYYTVAPDVTRPQDILCISSDENIASIEAIAGDAGQDEFMVRIRITGKATGHADMTVSLNETGTILGKYSVEVSSEKASTEVKLDIGEKKEENIYYTVAPDVTRPQDIFCTSSDESIASIEAIAGDAGSDGLMVRIRITGKATGHADMTVSLNETGTILGKYSVEVSDKVYNDETNEYGTVIVKGNCGAPQIDKLTWTIYDTDENGIGDTLVIDGLGAMKDYATSAPWHAYKESFERLIVGPGVTHIGNNAFYKCENLTGNLILPEVLTSIGRDAFYKCNFYGDLIIPNSVTTIGNSAFSYCTAFSKLYLSDDLLKIGDFAFQGCSGFTGDLVIPNKVTSIGNFAFSYCGNFTGDLVIPDSVTNIASYAFAHCGELTGKLILPSELKSIPDGCFYMSGFTGNLILPQTVT
ncbi:MAG: leucine-rich repeat domain-containing protein [Ruminococcus sp.]|nr:leucine-rich repeat domain-containing protein [Ruminococcus sp.]